MSEERKLRHRAFLETEILKVKEQLASTTDLEAPVKPDAAIGRLSRIDAMQQQQMQQAIRRRRQDQLERLESAFLLVEHGKYGICNLCGEDIPEARLELVPDTQMCAPCLTSIQEKG